MKKLFTIAAVAVVSLSFTSCRQDEETSDFGNATIKEKNSFGKVVIDTVKSDTIKIKAKTVDPDPPVKDGTSW